MIITASHSFRAEIIVNKTYELFLNEYEYCLSCLPESIWFCNNSTRYGCGQEMSVTRYFAKS